MKTNKHYFIIDTDPGVDDALGILFAVACGMPIKAVTTTYGNASIEDTTRNALTILELLHASIPVYKGASDPLIGKPYYATVHGNNGLGGFEKKLQTKEETTSLQNFLKNEQTKNTVICLGPTTNVARALQDDQEFNKKVDTLVILGGVVGQKGNVTPYAEFNVFNDPIALQQTLTIPCKKILIPINVCRSVVFTKEDFDLITNVSLRNDMKAITDLYISYYLSNTTHGGFTGGVMYDLLATMYPIFPELFETEEAYIEVETAKNDRYGETRRIQGAPANCFLLTNVDALKLKQIFFETVNTWK